MTDSRSSSGRTVLVPILLALMALLFGWLTLGRETPVESSGGWSAESGPNPEVAGAAAAEEGGVAPGGAREAEVDSVPLPSLAAGSGGVEVLVVRRGIGGSRSPVADMPVHLHSPGVERFGRSGADGVARFAGLPPDTSCLVRFDAFTAVHTRTTADEWTRVELVLRAAIEVDLEVVDPKGVPVVGARVTVTCDLAESPRVATTDQAGKCLLRELWSTAELRIDHEDGWAEHYLHTLPAGRSPLRLTMPRRTSPPRPASLRVFVVDSSGTAIEGATVIATEDEGAKSLRVSVGPTGLASVDGVHAGNWTVEARAPGYASDLTELVDLAGPNEIRFELERSGRIEVEVVHSGRPVPFAHVNGGFRLDARTDASGRVTLEVDPGQNGLTASKAGIGRAEGTVDVSAGGTATWVAELAAGEVVHGRVLDPERRPLPGLLVEVGDSKARTDRDGRFRVVGLLEGEHLLLVSRGVSPMCDPAVHHELVVTGVGSHEITVDLAASSGSIRGRLELGSEAWRPFVNASLHADAQHVHCMVSIDTDNRFSVEGLPPGDYEVRVHNSWSSGESGTAPATQRFGPFRVGTEVVDVGSLRVTAQAATDWRVDLSEVGDRARYVAVFDERGDQVTTGSVVDGRVHLFEGLGPGRYRAVTLGDGIDRSGAWVDVVAGAPNVVILRPQLGTSRSIKVVAARGGDREIRIDLANDRGAVDRVRLRLEGGEVTWRQTLVAGTYRVTVQDGDRSRETIVNFDRTHSSVEVVLDD